MPREHGTHSDIQELCSSLRQLLDRPRAHGDSDVTWTRDALKRLENVTQKNADLIGRNADAIAELTQITSTTEAFAKQNYKDINGTDSRPGLKEEMQCVKTGGADWKRIATVLGLSALAGTAGGSAPKLAEIINVLLQ